MGEANNSFTLFKAANPDKAVTGFDYLRLIYQLIDAPPDFVVWICKLMQPDFLEIKGRIFLRDGFDANRYDYLISQNHTDDEAQFWSNLLEITGVFEGLGQVEAKEIAEMMVSAWNRKINIEYPAAIGRARVLVDEGAGEVFVGVGFPGR